jgi:hypothetical protein
MPAASSPPRPPRRHCGSMIKGCLKASLACARLWPRRQMRTAGTS